MKNTLIKMSISELIDLLKWQVNEVLPESKNHSDLIQCLMAIHKVVSVLTVKLETVQYFSENVEED